MSVLFEPTEPDSFSSGGYAVEGAVSYTFDKPHAVVTIDDGLQRRFENVLMIVVEKV